MPFTIDDSSSDQILEIKIHGRHTDEEFLEIQDAMFDIPSFFEKSLLFNFSDVSEFLTTSEGIRNYVNRFASRPEQANINPNRRSAILSPSDLIFGMARVFIAHADGMRGTFQIFRKRDEALEWLNQSET